MNRLARRRCCDDLDLPVLTFGSMRFDPKRLDPDAGRELLAFLNDAGANALHSSHEYEFHNYFCDVLRSLNQKRWTHIVKLGEPHFDHFGFRPDRMIKIIEDQLRMLGTERIDIVQWLLRTTPLEDQRRLPLFESCRDAVAETAARLQEQGKIGVMTVFPYTPAFAEKSLPLSWCRGLVTYLNPAEREDAVFLDAMKKRDQFCVAIRPLFAGKLMNTNAHEAIKFSKACTLLGLAETERLSFLLRYPLLHPAVSSVMLSIGSRAHAEQVLGILCNATADRPLFGEASEAFAAAGL